jgi:hypothetical protein
MRQPLEEKTLGDGSRLTLENYFLGESEAHELARPVGSIEIVLRLTTADHNYRTPPAASWYFSEEHYHRLFSFITSETDYQRVRRFLDTVGSEKDTLRLDDFLKHFRTLPSPHSR